MILPKVLICSVRERTDAFGWQSNNHYPQAQVIFNDIALETIVRKSTKFSLSEDYSQMLETNVDLEESDIPDFITYSCEYWGNQQIRDAKLKTKPLSDKPYEFEMTEDYEQLFKNTQGDLMAKVSAVIEKHFRVNVAPKVA